MPDDETETKKPRRAERLEADPDKTPIVNKQHLPSPLTHLTDDSNELNKEPTATPPGQNQHEITPKKTEDTYSQGQALSSPPQDTQPLSQFVDRHPAISDDIEDEIREGVWGYLVPLDPKYGDKEANRELRQAGLNRLFLHAASLRFALKEQEYVLNAPLPDDLKGVLDRLGRG